MHDDYSDSFFVKREELCAKKTKIFRILFIIVAFVSFLSSSYLIGYHNGAHSVSASQESQRDLILSLIASNNSNSEEYDGSGYRDGYADGYTYGYSAAEAILSTEYDSNDDSSADSDLPIQNRYGNDDMAKGEIRTPGAAIKTPGLTPSDISPFPTPWRYIFPK